MPWHRRSSESLAIGVDWCWPIGREGPRRRWLDRLVPSHDTSRSITEDQLAQVARRVRTSW